MDDQYFRLIVESRLAKNQLEQFFESRPCGEIGPGVPGLPENPLTASVKKNSRHPEIFIRHCVCYLKRSWFSDLDPGFTERGASMNETAKRRDH